MKRTEPKLIGDILREFFERPYVARKVAEAAIKTGVAQLMIDDLDAYEASVAARIRKNQA